MNCSKSKHLTVDTQIELIFGYHRIRIIELGSSVTMITSNGGYRREEKVVSIDHFSPNFCLWSLQIFLLVRSNQEHLHVLLALLIREI